MLSPNDFTGLDMWWCGPEDSPVSFLWRAYLSAAAGNLTRAPSIQFHVDEHGQGET